MLVDPVTRDLISDPDPEMFERCKEIRGTIERVEDTIGSLKTCQRKKAVGSGRRERRPNPTS